MITHIPSSIDSFKDLNLSKHRLVNSIFPVNLLERQWSAVEQGRWPDARVNLTLSTLFTGFI